MRYVVRAVIGAAAIATLTACSGAGPASSAAPAGEPIKLVMISGTGPGAPGDVAYPGAEAAVKAVNAAGGVQGRPLEVTFCDAQRDINKHGACARDAVADQGVIATVANTTYNGGTAINPVLEQAGMAAVGTKPHTPSDYQSPAVFTIEGGGAAIVAGQNMFMFQQGNKKVAALIYGNESGASSTEFVKGQLSSLMGTSLSAVVTVSTTASDASPFVAEVLRGQPDAVSVSLTQNMSIGAVQQLRAQGFTGTIVCPSASFTAEALALAGDVGDLKVVGSYSYGAPGYKVFQSEMKAFDAKAALQDDTLNAWLAVHQFAKVMGDPSTSLTRQGVKDAFNKVSGYSTDGLTPPLTYTTPNPTPNFGRMFNPAQVLHEPADGGGWKDVVPTVFLDTLNGRTQPATTNG